MSADLNDDQRVGQLRQQLKLLGYLDAGVDRFLLGPASGARGPVGLAALASARVGLLGGMLLGPAAAIGIGARLPGLLSGVRDAVVIALYLSVFFLLAITITSFVVAILATAAARVRSAGFAKRAARVSRVAGWSTSLACLAYLTLWWRNANAGFGWSAPVWTAFALLVAVAISLLLGHAQRITTLAVLAAAAGPAASLPPVAGRSWRVVLLGGAAAFLGAAALLVATTTEPRVAPSRPALPVEGQGLTIRLIAIDGFDLGGHASVARSNPDSDPLPILIPVDPQDTQDPARAWTTIATGQPPDTHGVHQLETRRVAGLQGRLVSSDTPVASALRAATDVIRLTQPSTASREERRSKTIWEVAEDAGLRTAVINWWATWPAPPGPGIVISDRAVLRLEHGGALDSEIAPAELYPELQQHWAAIRDTAKKSAATAFRESSAIAALLRRSAELDSTILGILAALPGPARDLDVVYLPGLDIAQYALLNGGEGSAGSASVLSERLEAIKRYDSYLVRLLEPWLRPTGNQVVMVVTSPGRIPSPARGFIGAAYAGRHVDIRGDARAAVVDIAPTVLQMLGVPLSRELAGTPIGGVFRLDPSRARFVPTYGPPYGATGPRQGKPLDQEAIDRLRSLGYVR